MITLGKCKYCGEEILDTLRSNMCGRCSMLAVTIRNTKPSILEVIIRDEHISMFMEQKSKERK
jgi:hypothetical protein